MKQTSLPPKKRKLKTESESYGKIRAHSSLMYLNLRSEAPRTDCGEQTERKKNGKRERENFFGRRKEWTRGQLTGE